MPVSTDRHDWSRLNSFQLGKYAEYLTKMEFILFGCDVFSSEIDDHGIDFVVRTRQASHYDVQVKSFRNRKGQTPYIFMPKDRFPIHQTSLLAVVQFVQGEPAKLFLIQSCVGDVANPIFKSRDYGEGKKSPPEWGLTLSKKKLALLAEDYLFQSTVKLL